MSFNQNRPLNAALWTLCVSGMLASTVPASFGQSADSAHSKPVPPATDTAPAPMLPGAATSTLQPQGEPATSVMGVGEDETSVPILPGATNGTIGPPGSDVTVLKDLENQGSGAPFDPSMCSPSASPPPAYLCRTQQKTTCRIGKTESALIIGSAVSCVALSMFFLIKKKKAAFWTLGALAAAILAVAGYAWGTFGLFQ